MAKFCTGCGAPLADDKKFCTECGTPVITEEIAATPATEAAVHRQTPPPQTQPTYQQTQPTYQQAPPVMQQAPVYGGDVAPAKGSKYEPITAGGYIGIMLLMCIPIVGIILTIVWACGGCRKVNKRSLARASLIMMAVGFVISLIMGFVMKSLMNGAMDAVQEGSVLESSSVEMEVSSGEEGSEQSGLGGLLGLIGGLSGNGNSNVTNSNIEELQELEALLEGLEAAGGGDTSGFDSLIDGAIAANQDAEKLNDGWPKTLRPYPDGTATALASYRTEISGSSKETLHQWIEDLKGDGFKYQDFYDFGMSEEDMLSMDAWWGYDGNTYLSVSYYDGVVTIDHTKELPDLESYFGG